MLSTKTDEESQENRTFITKYAIAFHGLIKNDITTEAVEAVQ